MLEMGRHKNAILTVTECAVVGGNETGHVGGHGYGLKGVIEMVAMSRDEIEHEVILTVESCVDSEKGWDRIEKAVVGGYDLLVVIVLALRLNERNQRLLVLVKNCMW